MCKASLLEIQVIASTLHACIMCVCTSSGFNGVGTVRCVPIREVSTFQRVTTRLTPLDNKEWASIYTDHASICGN